MIDIECQYTIKVQKFEDGTPKEWVQHVITVEDLLLQAGWQDNYECCHSVWRAATKGKANNLLQFWHCKRLQETTTWKKT